METNGKADKPDRRLAERFAVLKQNLLLERLNGTQEFETHALILRQANEAEFLAWVSAYPLLTFPCLFEERVLAATEQARRQAHLYWNGLEAVTPASRLLDGPGHQGESIATGSSPLLQSLGKTFLG